MAGVWCIRANGGEFAKHFVEGGYAGIGWGEIKQDLGSIQSRDELYPIIQAAYPDQQSPIVVGNYVGQISRFLLDIQPGDYVITPAADSEWLHYGQVDPPPSYFHSPGEDGCRYRHRRRVTWKGKIARTDFSVPFQNTIRSTLTVFNVSHREEFLAAIGVIQKPSTVEYDPYRVVLEQILELGDKEFEILVSHLLSALGFEGSEVTGKTGDGGVDAVGELNAANMARVKIFVQAKRYKLGTRISANAIRQLRQAIPFGGQGAFITTADYQKNAAEVALQEGFPRIGLINGNQLVDLLVEHWEDIPEEFQQRLGLRRGLVRL